MTAIVPVGILRHEQPRRRGLPAEARLYLFTLLAATVIATLAASVVTSPGFRWRDLVVLLLVAPAAQAFAEHGPANQVFHTGLAFTMAAVLLLPPELVVLVCVAQHLPEWARQQYPWFIQTFNIANFAASALVASAVWHATGAAVSTSSSSVAGAAGAAVSLVVVNHVLLARMLQLARGRSLAETHLLALDGLTSTGVVATVGVAFALCLHDRPALAALSLVPLVLVQRALAVPALREEASRDHKTGLLNARGVERAAAQELERAARFDRPLSLIVCDVDNLRAINNTHGHLAGDAALTTVADTLCTVLRDYDLCGRFGGDEFVIVLPETPEPEAFKVAARIDESLASRTIVAGRAAFTATVSLGIVSTSSQSHPSFDELLAAADADMYRAKRGRAAHGLAD